MVHNLSLSPHAGSIALLSEFGLHVCTKGMLETALIIPQKITENVVVYEHVSMVSEHS